MSLLSVGAYGRVGDVARRALPPRRRRHTAAPPRQRLAGLDGVRGLAALFVVVNHVFLRAFPGYPEDRAPFWAAWFIYGRFAVVVFIVLSGFSLALAPARHGWRLDGVSAVRAAARPAHPPGVLGRPRLQPRGGVARRRSAGKGRARREVGPRQQPAGAEPRRCADPQPIVLVDRRRGPAVHRVPAAAADGAPLGRRRHARHRDAPRGDGGRPRPARRPPGRLRACSLRPTSPRCSRSAS